jgi:hypothetical protein
MAVYKLPMAFWNDYVARSVQPCADEVVKIGRKKIWIRLDQDQATQLALDAKQYHDPKNKLDTQSNGLYLSARATTKALTQQNEANHKAQNIPSS